MSTALVRPSVGKPTDILREHKRLVGPKFRDPSLVRVIVVGDLIAVQDQGMRHQVIPRFWLTAVVPSPMPERVGPDGVTGYDPSHGLEVADEGAIAYNGTNKGHDYITRQPGYICKVLERINGRQGFTVVEQLTGMEDADQLDAIQAAILPDPELTELAAEDGIVDNYHAHLDRRFRELRNEFRSDADMVSIISAFENCNKIAFNEKRRWLGTVDSEIARVRNGKDGRYGASTLEERWRRETGYRFRTQNVDVIDNLGLTNPTFEAERDLRQGAHQSVTIVLDKDAAEALRGASPDSSPANLEEMIERAAERQIEAMIAKGVLAFNPQPADEALTFDEEGFRDFPESDEPQAADAGELTIVDDPPTMDSEKAREHFGGSEGPAPEDEELPPAVGAADIERLLDEEDDEPEAKPTKGRRPPKRT
jgi:hypothetical protein